MAPAEAETSHDERASPGGLVYDGFISYGHASADLLAPVFQVGLQRFAKLWRKRWGLPHRRWPDPPVSRVEALLVGVPGDA